VPVHVVVWLYRVKGLVRPERDAARDGDRVDGRRWLSSGRDAPNST